MKTLNENVYMHSRLFKRYICFFSYLKLVLKEKTVFTSNHKLTENSDLLCQNMFMILLLSVAVSPRAFVLKF